MPATHGLFPIISHVMLTLDSALDPSKPLQPPHRARTWAWSTLVSVAVHVACAAAVLSMPVVRAAGLGPLSGTQGPDQPLLLLPQAAPPPQPPPPKPEPVIKRPPPLTLGNDAATEKRETWLSSPAEGEHIARPSTIDQPALRRTERPEPPPAPPPSPASEAGVPQPKPTDAAPSPQPREPVLVPKGLPEGEEVPAKPLKKQEAAAPAPRPGAPVPPPPLPRGSGEAQSTAPEGEKKPDLATEKERAKDAAPSDLLPAQKPVDATAAPPTDAKTDTRAKSTGVSPAAQAREREHKAEAERAGQDEGENAVLPPKGVDQPTPAEPADAAPEMPDAQPSPAVPPRPSGRGKPVEMDTDAWMADREADGSSVKRAATFRNGKVEAGQGLDIRTVRPIFTAVTRALAFPTPPVVEVKFDKAGMAKRVRIIRSSGYDDVDGPIVNAVYQWLAAGKALATVGDEPDAGLVMRVTFLLN